MKIAIFGKQFDLPFHVHCMELFSVIKQLKGEVVVYQPLLEFINKSANLFPIVDGSFTKANEILDCDVLLSIGGDGTFLEAVTLVGSSGIPIAGINIGRLGYLADIAKEEMPEAIKEIIEGNYQIRQLDLLEVDTPGKEFGHLNFGLNEFAITKRDSSSMMTIHTWLNDEFLNSYWADGLIIATPTGSTAYSLSVGGPIVHPLSENFVISPIAPHNLTMRPFVISNKMEILLKIEARGGKFLASIDSRSQVFDQSIEIRVRKAGFTVNTIVRNQHSFYTTLRNKLMWGLDKRN